MGIDNIIILSLSIIVFSIIAMLNKLIALAMGFLAVGMAILLATKNTFVAAPFLLLSIFFFVMLGRQYLFEKRVYSYISEGQIIHDNEYLNDTYSTSDDYVAAMTNWTNKVAKDICGHKGQPEVTIFLDQQRSKSQFCQIDGNTDSNKRHFASTIIMYRIERLKELQKRL